MLIRDLIQQSKKQLSEYALHQNDIYALLGAVLKVDKLHLFTLLNREITSKEVEEFKLLWARYLHHEPLQYILGYTYFYGLKFNVSPAVLIPRFDSEILVDTLLKENDHRPLRVIDLGTGSGNLAICLKKHRPTWLVSALDNSLEALEMAQLNAKTQQVEIQFIHQDMVEHMKQQQDSYDLIVCNPPYIDIKDPDAEQQVRDYEPTNALFALEEGLYYYKKLLDLRLSSPIYFEIGYQQKEAIMAYSKNYVFHVYQDLSGHDRIIKARIKDNNL